MIKKVIASIFLLGLVVVFIYNVVEERARQQEETLQNQSTETGFQTGLAVGEKAPDFTVQNLRGDVVSLSDFKGQPVMVNFWATWCGPCKEEMPAMENFSQEFGQEIKVLAVNATSTELDGVNKVEKFIDEYNLTFEVLLDQKAAITDSYQVLNIPTTFFINKEGVIEEVKMGPMTETYMENVLKQMY